MLSLQSKSKTEVTRAKTILRVVIVLYKQPAPTRMVKECNSTLGVIFNSPFVQFYAERLTMDHRQDAGV